MTRMSNEAIQNQIRAVGLIIQIGEGVKASDSSAVAASSLLYADSSSNLANTAVTASKVVYIDSNSVPQSAALPFEVEITAANDTTFAFLDLTGRSSVSDDQLLSGTLVQGSQVTTFTVTGYVRMNLTDNGGNITDGIQYLQVGTIT